MNLIIDFYSKEELAIRIDFAGRYPMPKNETSELFLFACYTLRQFSNLGTHPVASVLAVLLTSFTKNTAIDLSQDNYQFPGPFAFGVLTGLQKVHLDINYDVLSEQLFSKIPKIVNYKGDGKKSFNVVLPPFRLNHKGFGLLGFQINYYVFHSVVALFTYLARNHIDDEEYLENLSKVAIYCGKAQLARIIPMGDQVALANTILNEVGIIL